jgi:amino acid permease
MKPQYEVVLKVTNRVVKTNRWGVPYVAVFLTSIGSCVCFITGIVGNGVVLTWLIALSGVTTMIAWASITFGAYRFRRAWSAQGRSQSELLYRAPGKLKTVVALYVLG